MTWKQPSYLSSTFSACTIITVVGLVILCFVVKDVATLKEVTLLILGGYAVKKGTETGKNGGANGQTPPVDKIPVP